MKGAARHITATMTNSMAPSAASFPMTEGVNTTTSAITACLASSTKANHRRGALYADVRGRTTRANARRIGLGFETGAR